MREIFPARPLCRGIPNFSEKTEFIRAMIFILSACAIKKILRIKQDYSYIYFNYIEKNVNLIFAKFDVLQQEIDGFDIIIVFD